MSKEKPTLTLISLYDPASYGLRILATFLSKNGYTVNQIYFKDLYTSNFPYTDCEFNHLMDLIKEIDTDIVGISLRSSSFRTAIDIAESVHERFNIPVMMGGTHATICPEECIEYADIVCIGEGEYPLLELMGKFAGDISNLVDIPNLWIKLEDKIFKNKPRPLIENLDDISIVDYAADKKYLIENDKVVACEPLLNNSIVEIFSSRGCPFHCTYCSNNILKKVLHEGKYVRRRSVKNVMEELIYATGIFKNIKFIVFGDEVFSFDKNWVSDFCMEYKEKIHLPFSAMFYPTLVYDEVLQMLKEAGMSHARTGIQSGSETIRKTVYRRDVSDEIIIESANKFHNVGVRLTFDAIVNNPYEDDDELNDSLNFFLSLPRPFELNLSSLVYFPKTELTRKAINDGFIKEEYIEGKDTHEALTLSHVLMKNKKMVYGYDNDLFWNSMFSLTSKSFLPHSFIHWLSKRNTLKEHPATVLYFAKFANILNIGIIVLYKLKNREMGFKDLIIGPRGIINTATVSK